MTVESQPESKAPARASAVLKITATWGVVFATAAWTAFFLGYLVAGALWPSAVPEGWFLQLVREHPGGTIGVAVSAISAFSVVAVLDVLARDPIEIKFIGFELKGAAGPVVLWVICFLALVAGGKTLWDVTGLVPSTATTHAAPKK